jgi:hypothetical protein
LEALPEQFVIQDNCGGIPPDYVSDAFSLGRPSIEKDGDLPTIGMYGIGMKRAIFKMAESAVVTSNHSEQWNEVAYDKQWLNPENNDWMLPLRSGKSRKEPFGVTISVPTLKKDVSKQFQSSHFINSLIIKISSHFGYIIQRGLSIFINGVKVKESVLHLLDSDPSEEYAIRPFDYKDTIDGVSIRVIVGFYRPLVTDGEIDEASSSAQEGLERAGVSVVCNDRVIILADRSLRTGWGDGGVPRFHPQFRAIAGLIDISSNDASKLPIATTKNDLDAGSDVYLHARQACVEGIKIFTNFTNRWKGMEGRTLDFFDSASPKEARRAIALADTSGRRVSNSTASRFRPNLPEPHSKDPRKRISFVRESSQIKAVSRYLFDDEEIKPGDVGAQCFDLLLEQAEKND